MSKAGPNRALRALLAEAEWTEDHLARQIRDLAAEIGLTVRPDRTSVSHWLAGRRPRPPVPVLAAEAFSRALCRTVTIEDTALEAGRRAGSAPTGLPSNPPPTQDVVTVLGQLAEFSGERRQLLAAGTFSLAGLAIPAWAGTARILPDPDELASPRLTAGQIATAEQMMSMFSDTDHAFGGGHSRVALASYLAHDVSPRLRAPASPALRERMFATAIQLAYLAGHMCFDDRAHGLAQRYYRVVLDLAVENDDPASYAMSLRAMSVQARSLGHHAEAVQLAIIAVNGRRRSPPDRHAFLYGQLAVCHAAHGDRAGAVTALTAAERSLNKTTSGIVAPIGGYHAAALAHQEAAVRNLLGDRPGAVKALTTSLRHRPATERRSRAITTARLAELHLANGHLDRAMAAWTAFVDDYPALSSGRATAALAAMRASLRPHIGHPPVRHLLTRMASI